MQHHVSSRKAYRRANPEPQGTHSIALGKHTDPCALNKSRPRSRGTLLFASCFPEENSIIKCHGSGVPGLLFCACSWKSSSRKAAWMTGTRKRSFLLGARKDVFVVDCFGGERHFCIPGSCMPCSAEESFLCGRRWVCSSVTGQHCLLARPVHPTFLHLSRSLFQPRVLAPCLRFCRHSVLGIEKARLFRTRASQ